MGLCPPDWQYKERGMGGEGGEGRGGSGVRDVGCFLVASGPSRVHSVGCLSPGVAETAVDAVTLR